MSYKRTTDDWLRIFASCGVKRDDACAWAPIFAEHVHAGVFSKGEEELDDFVGQVLHESHQFSKLEENLYYRTPGLLMRTWPSRFKSLHDELPYLRNPEKLANKVYGGRMGNVNPGDGWRNRGSGILQITGADNLRAVQRATGIPVFDDPELLRIPSAESIHVVIAWWEGNVPDSAINNVVKVTKAVNGQDIGLADRIRLTSLVTKELYA